MRTFVKYLITFCSRPKAVSDVISGTFVGRLSSISVSNFVVLAETVLEKLHHKTVGGCILDTFRYNFQLEVDNDVISGVAVGNIGMDVHVKFGDSRSNGFRDIRGADFVSNERTGPGKRSTICVNGGANRNL